MSLVTFIRLPDVAERLRPFRPGGFGVYLSRYGHLRTSTTDHWTSRPDFAEMEAWFFDRAWEEYGD